MMSCMISFWRGESFPKSLINAVSFEIDVRNLGDIADPYFKLHKTIKTEKTDA